MQYRNKKTGIVIDIEGELTGGDWEKVKISPDSSKRKKAGAKNGTICDSK